MLKTKINIIYSFYIFDNFLLLGVLHEFETS